MTDTIEVSGTMGPEAGETVGYRTYDVEFEADEEEPESPKEEPEKEGAEGTKGAEGAEEESEEEGEEGEPGDEEEEEDEDALPKVSKELEAERKNLLKSYTTKMKGVAGMRIKAQLVDAIEKNPATVIPMLAQKFGISLGEKAAPEPEPTLEFKTVEVAPKANEELNEYLGRFMKANLEPVLQAIGKAAKGKPTAPAAPVGPARGASTAESDLQSAIAHLDEKYPDWGLYEDRMVELVTKHGSLMRDPDELYKLAKASVVNVSDAKKAAKLAKKKGKSGERPGKVVKVATTGKGRKLSFDQSWELAKQTLMGGKP